MDYDTINPGGSDVPVTTNPSYNVHTKPYSKTSEDEYNYVKPNDVDGYLKIYPWHKRNSFTFHCQQC